MADEPGRNPGDELLRVLARLAKEEKEEEMTRLDSRWDALSHGELDAEDEADLRSRAEGSSEMRAAWEAFRPVDGDFRQRLTERLRTMVGRRPSIRRWPLAAAAALAAALLGLLLSAPGPGPRQAELPAYFLEARGGRATERAAPEGGGVPRLAGDLRLELSLFPESPVEGEVTLTAFLEQGGTLRPWPIPGARLRVAPSGACLLEVRAGDLGLEPGPATLWLAVARPRWMPQIGELRSLIAGSGDHRVRLLSQELLLEPGGDLPVPLSP